jgi:hypothetical protein
VRFARVLAGGLYQPGARDAVRRAHDVFAALGSVARPGIYNNMKTAVDKVKKGKGRVVNARFAAMCSHYPVFLSEPLEPAYILASGVIANGRNSQFDFQ